MRAVLILAAGLLGAGLVRAAPRALPAPSPPPPTDAALQAEAGAFAQQLLMLTEQITGQYVRPVERADLIHAALSGLYEVARLPAPRDLRARILKAEAADRLPPTPGGGPPGAGGIIPVNALGDRALAELIEKVRIEVGGSEFLQGQNVLLVACRALGRSLDPYTVPVTAEEQRHAVGLNQVYDGVGLELDDVARSRARVRTVQPGSPAQRADLRPGDEITHLDGKSVAEIPATVLRMRLQQVTPDEIVEKGPGSVKVRVHRPGGKEPREVSLTGERFRPESVWGVTRQDDNSWDYWLDRRRRIAHVRVGPLAKGTAEDLFTALTDLRDNGMKGLILDLRWCPGGFLDEAANCAELFVGAVVVATVKSRTEGERVFRSAGQHQLEDFPVVVLVNGETSGGGELIAAALKDHNRVRVAGQRTLGKASVQTPLFLGTAGLGMKVTSGTFLRPSGKNLHRFPDSKETDDWGVRPDPGLEMRLSAEAGRQLKQWWLWQTLRPGSSREALPLDDPENDPQRQTALAALVEQVERKVRARSD